MKLNDVRLSKKFAWEVLVKLSFLFWVLWRIVCFKAVKLFAAFRHENVKHIAWLAHSKSKLALENYRCTLKIDMNNNQSIILKIFHKIK